MTTLRISIVGAESTGKTTLAGALTGRINHEFALRAVEVPEALRHWCSVQGRTPRIDEQAGIARLQQAWIDEAARDADVVVCDTTPLMIAVYSRLVFGDRSLDEMARACHASIDFTLLTGLDVPWVADGLQRDGPHVRGPVDASIRSHLVDWNADWAVVLGSGEARTANGLDALRRVLGAWGTRPGAPTGLFSSLLASGTGPNRPASAACPRCEPTRPLA
ncbi:MAG: ATP-binding protein [Burkholderiaceae bacterium]